MIDNAVTKIDFIVFIAVILNLLPSLPFAVERVEQRSAFGVSKLRAMHLRAYVASVFYSPGLCFARPTLSMASHKEG